MSGNVEFAADSTYNILRIGSLHFSQSKLDKLRRALARVDTLEAADARLAASDFLERRAAIDAVAVVDPDWFFRRFDLTFFDDMR
jgi:hypothetical protein